MKTHDFTSISSSFAKRNIIHLHEKKSIDYNNNDLKEGDTLIYDSGFGTDEVEYVYNKELMYNHVSIRFRTGIMRGNIGLISCSDLFKPL